MLRPGDFERARDRVGEVMSVEVSDGGEETVKSFKSVQRCWCWRLWRISMAKLSRGDLVVVLARRVEIEEGSVVDMVMYGCWDRSADPWKVEPMYHSLRPSSSARHVVPE